MMNILNFFKPEIFRRDDGYVRYDWAWYGFGYYGSWMTGKEGRHKRWWINSYRRAPVSISWVNAVMWFAEKPKKRINVFFNGSYVDPFHSWTLKIGRFGIGGKSPSLLIAYKRWQQRREMDRYGRELVEMCRRYGLDDDIR